MLMVLFWLRFQQEPLLIKDRSWWFWLQNKIWWGDLRSIQTVSKEGGSKE